MRVTVNTNGNAVFYQINCGCVDWLVLISARRHCFFCLLKFKSNPPHSLAFHRFALNSTVQCREEFGCHQI